MNVRTCLLCEATSAGTLVRFRKKRDICDMCVGDLAARGLAWCVRGRHKVAARDMAAGKANCKACEAARDRGRDKRPANTAWRAANQERIQAYRQSAQYRESQRTYYRERRRADADYREKEKARLRAHYAANRDAIQARIRRWRQEKKLAAWRRMMGTL